MSLGENGRGSLVQIFGVWLVLINKTCVVIFIIYLTSVVIFVNVPKKTLLKHRGSRFVE